jgi:hypothetical protein
VAVHALSLPDFDVIEQIRLESATLPEVVVQRDENLAGKADKRWVIIDSIVTYDDRVFLSVSSVSWAMVLE